MSVVNKKTLSWDMLIDKIQYYSLSVYVVLVYLFDGNPDYYLLIYLPIMVFAIIELGFIVRNKKIMVSKPILMMFLFTAFCFLTCIWAQYKDIAMSKSATVLFLTFVLALMHNYCLRTKKTVDNILVVLLVAGLVFTVYIIGYYSIGTLLNMLSSHYVRIGDGINNANVVGMELALTAIVAIYFGINKSRKYYLLSAIPIVLSLGTASKKAVFFIILGTITLVILKKKNNFKMIDLIKKIILPIAIFVLSIFVIQSGILPTLTDRLNEYSSSFTGEGKVDDSTIVRNKMIQYGFESFLEHPIGGLGIGNSGDVAMAAAGRDTYLHNNYIELLATVGLLGTIIYYSVFVVLLILVLKNRIDRRFSIIITILLLCLILDWGTVSYYSKNTYIYMLLFALFCSNAYSDDKRIKSKYITK